MLSVNRGVKDCRDSFKEQSPRAGRSAFKRCMKMGGCCARMACPGETTGPVFVYDIKA